MFDDVSLIGSFAAPHMAPRTKIMIYAMGLALEDLDPRTRTFMVSELNTDGAAGRLYISPWLTDEGRRQWPGLLRITLHAHDDRWLADTLDFNELLRSPGRREATELAERAPPTAAKTLAEGQFHGFYVRGVCRRALEDGIKTVTVFRAGPTAEGARAGPSGLVDSALVDSALVDSALVDSVLCASSLLEDLRACSSVAPAARYLGGLGSGLSVRIPLAARRQQS